MIAIMAFFGSAMCFAQNTAGNYEAGTTALTTVSEEIAKYVPIVVKLCYAIAGVVAVVGAISVYIAMNNEEQDVKNILVFSNCRDYIRKQIEDKTLSINLLGRIFNFQIFA
jgi:TRAP-type C4-dicarboxylate transport system permease small subunit